MSDAKSDFDVAKAVSDLLSGIGKERQQRVLRWVAESLDIMLHIKAHSAAETAATPSGVVLLNGTPSAAPRGAAADIKTFMEEKKPKSDTQFVAATAYYYRFEAAAEDKKDSINADVLQDAARLAGRARFSKPTVTLNNAKKQGYVDASERGAFKINSVGENLVAMALPGTQNTSQTKPRRPSKTKSAAKKKRA